MKKVNIKVEFEPRWIRHMTIQCPKCQKWFYGCDILKNEAINNESDICEFARCECPACEFEFNLGNVEIDENVSFPEFYENCAKMKVTWE